MAKSKFDTGPSWFGRWLRRLIWLCVLLVVLVAAVYIIGTSTAFLKGVILPKVSKAIDMDVTLTDAQISPFSLIMLSELRVQPRGGEPLLKLREIRASYNLRALIDGHIVVNEVVIESPVVTIIENADGTRNIDAFTKAKGPAKEKKSVPAKPATPSAAPQVDIKKIALNNATVRFVKNYKDGRQDVTEVTGLNFTVSDIRNGQSGRLELAAALAAGKVAQPPAAAGSLQAKLISGFDFALTPDLKPASVKGKSAFTIDKATGSLADLNALIVRLDCELTATELKQLALSFTRADAALGEVRISGPLDPEKGEGKLKLEILGIDKRVLNLAGAASGMDFGTTTIDSSSDIELSQGGSLISIMGRFDIAHLQVKRQNQISPTLDLRADYAVTVDSAAQSALIKTLNLTGAQNSQPLLQSGLSGPMTIAWGKAGADAGDATLNLSVTNLNLADWKAFAGEGAPEGVANVTAKLLSQKTGKELAFDLDARLNNIATGTGSARVNQGDLHAQVQGSAADMKQFKLDNYQLEIFRQGQSALKVSGSGTFDSETQDADVQIILQTALARLLSSPGATASSGAVDFKGRVSNKQKKINVAGTLALVPTDRAKNELQLAGDVDVSHADAITGSFKITAESLDATHYYDLISGNTNSVANPQSPPADQPAVTAAPASSEPAKEPAAIKLPFKNFIFDLNIGHLFLSEVDIANWKTTVKLDGGLVAVTPCQLTLNGAPIKATVGLDLGVPGYKYDVAFDANAIPLAPLVNSFAPDRKGQFAGTTSADAQIKGAGITGASLQKNLSGQFNFSTTNMSLSIENVRSRSINLIINAIVSLPDLIRNPLATIGSLFGAKSKGGWADEMTASPIDVVAVNVKAGGGRVQLQHAEVRSKAFQALATGEVVLAPVLNDSKVQVPVKIALARAMAEKIGLVNASTPADAVYVALPDFLKMKGTVGKLKEDIDKLALLELAAKAGGGVGKGIGGAAASQAGSLLNAVGGMLGGKSSGSDTNAAASTNAAPASGGLLDLFKKKKK